MNHCSFPSWMQNCCNPYFHNMMNCCSPSAHHHMQNSCCTPHMGSTQNHCAPNFCHTDSSCGYDNPMQMFFDYFKCFTQKSLDNLKKCSTDSSNGMCFESLQAKINFWQENFNKFYETCVKNNAQFLETTRLINENLKAIQANLNTHFNTLAKKECNK